MTSPPLLSIPTINFLGRFKTRLLFEAKRHYIIQTTCVVLLILFGMGLLGIYTYQAYITFQHTRTLAAIDQEIAIIEQLSAFEQKFVSLKEKTASVLLISQTMQQHQKLVEGILQLLPQGMIVTDVEIHPGAQLIFSASTNEPEIMQQFITNLEAKNPQTASLVKQAVVNTTDVDTAGQYKFAVEVQLDSLAI